MQYIKKHFGLLFILILSFWVVKQLFIPGFFPMHDDTQVARVYEMGKSLKDGMFPVRWVSDLGYGYGYPIFNFYAPLAYYVGGFLNVAGFDPLIATKITMIIGILLAGISMYFLAREFWGETGGVVSGLFYIYAPYHALDIYVRGDVAEFWAYAFIPLVFYGLWKTYKLQKWRYVIIGSLGYAGVILSHNLTALMTTPFLLIASLFNCFIANKGKKISTLRFQLSTIFLGLFLSAFYWLPALFEMKYTNVLSQIGGGADFRDHFVCISQLWKSGWGFGGSAPGCVDGLSFKIGKLHIVLFIASLFLLLRKFNTYNIKKVTIIFFSILAVFSVLLTLSFSKPLWEFIKPMEFLQYPWRFLLFASFFLSFLGGFCVFLLKNIFYKAKYSTVLLYVSVGVLIFALIYFNADLFIPQTIFQTKASDFTNELALKWKTSKTSDEYMPKDFVKPKNETEIVKNKITVENGIGKIEAFKEKTQELSAQVTILKTGAIKVNTAYFPFWNVYINEKNASYIDSHRGFVIFLPPGQYKLTLQFQETLIEQIANSISIVGMILFFTGIIYSIRRSIW